MGLLDDAIREHLELRRLHGADLSEVAREEHEALGPVRHGGSEAPDERMEAAEDLVHRAEEVLPPRADVGSTGAHDPIQAGQETAELDMSTVLRTEQAVGVTPVPATVMAVGADETQPSASAGTPPASVGGPPARPPAQAATAEDSLEWEVPGSPQDASREGAGDGKPVDAAAGPPGEPVEDVLEETPDFLRETPDQERLWFEQQPPRDFDFEKK